MSSEDPPEAVVEFVLDARYGDDDAVKAAIADGIDVNAKSHGGACALLMASGNGHTEIVKLLLEAKASTETANESKSTALHWACLNGHLDVVKSLLEAKANADVKNDFGKRPFEEAYGKGHTEVCEIIAASTNFEGDFPQDPNDKGDKEDDDGEEKKPSKAAKPSSSSLLQVGSMAKILATGKSGNIALSNGHAMKVLGTWYLAEELEQA
eukprot:TRINITY_DN6223_c0_g1_i1.p1 TRINITY_DN6223_c0_g1~~TRINITY_DN6223_c0_g1_i1.p1  ORF type:complete len:210 (-),score=71.03 TRINITY_DN6223_c0_g1_i1:149-778(-)